jgi:hypothetical protein
VGAAGMGMEVLLLVSLLLNTGTSSSRCGFMGSKATTIVVQAEGASLLSSVESSGRSQLHLLYCSMLHPSILCLIGE